MSTTQASSVGTERSDGDSAAIQESAYFASGATGLPVRVRRAATVQAPYLAGAEAVAAGKGFKAWDTTSDAVVPTSRASVWELRAIWLGLVAFAMAGVGEALLFSEERRGLGVALLLAAAVVAVVAWGQWRTETPTASNIKKWWRIAWRRGLILRLAGITTALALAVGSMAAYIHEPNETFGLQGVLWLAGIGLFLLSCARWYPRATAEATTQGLAWTLLEGMLFAGLIMLALFTHLAYLGQIPWRMHFDEGYAYLETMRYYRGPVYPLFTTTWQGTSLPSLWFGIQGLLMHITGRNLAGVRMGVALAGALTVIPVYGLGRLLAGRLGAALAAFGVAVSAVYVHYSRVSIINVTTALPWAVCFFFLIKGLRSRRPGDFAWAGLAAGLSMYTYYGTRLLPYLLAAFLVYMMLFHFKATRERLGHFALVAVGFVVGFGPLMGYFFLFPDMWAARGLRVMNVPAAIPTTWDAIVSDWNVLAPLVWQNFLGLSVLAGRDTVYYAAFLLPWEAALVVLGVGLLVWRWRQPAAFLVLLWGFGVVLTGGTLLDASTIPNFAHWAPAFPAFFLALALPLALWGGALLKVSRRSWRVAAVALLVLLPLADLGANAYAYVVQYPPKVPPDASLEGSLGRYMESVEPNTRVLIVGDTWGWTQLDPAITEIMASPGSYADSHFDPGKQLPVDVQDGQNLAFVFFNDMFERIPAVQSYYPGGRPGDIRSPDGTLIARTYFVPWALAKR
jgi:hypothetical protein